MSRVKPPPPGFRGVDKETGTGKPGGGPDPDGIQRSGCTGVIPCPVHDLGPPVASGGSAIPRKYRVATEECGGPCADNGHTYAPGCLLRPGFGTLELGGIAISDPLARIADASERTANAVERIAGSGGTLSIPPELIYGDRGVSVAPTDPDSALSSLAEVAERNGSAVAMIRHAADSAHYSTASWPGMGEWLTGNVPAIRTLADDLTAWCDTQTLARNVPRGTSTADEGA